MHEQCPAQSLSGARPGLTGRGLRSPSARRRLKRGPGRAASSAPGASEPGPGAAAAHPTAGPSGLDKGRKARGAGPGGLRVLHPHLKAASRILTSKAARMRVLKSTPTGTHSLQQSNTS